MHRFNSCKMLAWTALFLLIPAYAFASDVVTSKHLFKKDQHIQLKLRECENGNHPIVIAHNADPKKLADSSIPIVEHVMRNNEENYFTVNIEEDTEGVIAQFCDPRTIKPYFDSLKENNTAD